MKACAVVCLLFLSLSDLSFSLSVSLSFSFCVCVCMFASCIRGLLLDIDVYLFSLHFVNVAFLWFGAHA